MTDEPTKLFVYGIFLNEYNRERYGMTNPSYDTVLDFATFGHGIVQASYLPGGNLSLTGLLVDYDPEVWENLDRLEGGYDRIIVTTTRGERAYMYAEPSKAFENHSTYQPAAVGTSR